MLRCPHCGRNYFERPLNVDEAAAMIGRSGAWLRKNRERLARDESFPLPLPTSSRPQWDGAAIDAWIQLKGGRAALEAAIAGVDRERVTHDTESRLAARAAELVGEGG